MSIRRDKGRGAGGQKLANKMLCNFWMAPYQLFPKTTGPNCMRFSGMICHHPKANQIDFGSDQVKGQGPGHEKVKKIFLP